MRKMRQTENHNKTDRQDPNKLPSTEVFDSSRYDAMDNMTKGATTTNQLPGEQQAVTGVRTKELLNPREIKNEAKAVGDNTPKPSDAKIDPMMTEEESARTMREMHQEISSSPPSPPPDAGMEENAQQGEVRVIEQKSKGYGYNEIPGWPEDVMRQYVEMVTAGMRLYSQLLESSTDTVRLWLAAWRSWLPGNNKD
jgi:hypothetical protein